MRLLVIILLLLITQVAYSQPCKEEKLKDKNKRLILEGFISQSGQEGLLTREKGVVSLTRSKDSLSQEVWSLSIIQIYDYEKSNTYPNWIPRGYYNINGLVVLIYDKAHLSKPIDSLQSRLTLQCMEAVIRDRVTPKQPVEEKWEWIDLTDELGETMKRMADSTYQPGRKRIWAQKSPGMSTVCVPTGSYYVFKKDGSVRKLSPLIGQYYYW